MDELYRIEYIKTSRKPITLTHLPDSNKDGEWWKYEISGGKENLVGWRYGKKEDAEMSVDKLCKSMNSRIRGKTSKALRLSHSSPRNIPVSTFNRRA